VTNFTNTVTLSGSATGISQLLISPTVSGNFSNGQWTGNITVQQSGSNAVVRADDGTATPGRPSVSRRVHQRAAVHSGATDQSDGRGERHSDVGRVG